MPDPQPPVIGIDLGGTNMQIGVVESDGRLLARLKRKTQARDGRERVIERIAGAARDACGEAGLSREHIGAVGIVAPGAIDIPRGVVIEAPNLGWESVPLRDELREHLEIDVVVDNDVNGAIWGEYHLGAGRGEGDVLGIWVGTGVGGGLILGGRLFHGEGFTAGEIGQTVINPDGPPGERTVEDLCSRTGMSRIIQRRLPIHPESLLHDLTDSAGRVTGSKKLAAAFERGDPLAREIVERGARYLGIAIANQATMLSVPHVILGGGVTEALGKPFRELVRQSFELDVFPHGTTCDIEMTKLEADAGVLGAAMLARDAVARV